jgi:phage RecT family recombinase
MANIQTTQSAPASNPITEFRDSITRMESEIRAILPKHVTIEAFQRVVLTSVQMNEDLLKANRKTLFNACLSAAKDGLLPDGKEAAFAIFNVNTAKKGEPAKWEKSVQYMPMVAGILKRVRQSDEISTIAAHVVYENDDFDYQLGDDERIYHKPVLANRGKPVAVYAISTMRSGERVREVMPWEEIEKIRSFSKAKDGAFWTNWPDEMARNKVIRRLCKRLPVSTDLPSDPEEYGTTPGAMPEHRARLVAPVSTSATPAPALPHKQDQTIPVAIPATETEAAVVEQEKPATEPQKKKLAKPASAEKIDKETGEIVTDAAEVEENPFN